MNYEEPITGITNITNKILSIEEIEKEMNVALSFSKYIEQRRNSHIKFKYCVATPELYDYFINNIYKKN